MREDLTSLHDALADVSQGIECSVVVPIYGDGQMAEVFCAELERTVFRALRGGSGEAIFVNDGSLNDSQERLQAVAARYQWVTVVELSRNFGQHVAVSCGYRYASGRYVASLNVDMQDAPDQIPNLIKKLIEEKADIAIALREDRQDSLLVKLSSTAFALTLNFLTGSHVPLNASTMRVMSRQFLNAFLEFGERNPYIPGLEMWMGFRKVYVPIPHRARKQGKSSYTLRARIRLAYNCIVSFSDYPLKLMTGVGLGSVGLGLLWGAYVIWVRLTDPAAQMGFASLLSAVIVFGGLNLMGLGVASLYIGRILAEVQRRPAYVVRSILNARQGASTRLREQAPLELTRPA